LLIKIWYRFNYFWYATPVGTDFIIFGTHHLVGTEFIIFGTEFIIFGTPFIIFGIGGGKDWYRFHYFWYTT